MRWFELTADMVTKWAGSPPAVIGSVLIVLLWAVTGPMFGFSDTWQLVINTGTTILTFNMVFLIQTTQNRDSRAVHVKLDEIIDALENSSNRAVALEEESLEEIERIHTEQREKKRHG